MPYALAGGSSEISALCTLWNIKQFGSPAGAPELAIAQKHDYPTHINSSVRALSSLVTDRLISVRTAVCELCRAEASVWGERVFQWAINIP